jgi:DDE superfamily endonuclease
MANAHKGVKLPMPSRTYNLTVNHRRQILSTTRGHPSRWNDKTLVLFDAFAKGIYDGTVLSDVEFGMLEHDENREIVTVRYKGAWLLVDNGYLRWPTTVPPFKESIHYDEIRFSQWLESMRKDVECTFGIMKGRFRILKTGVRLHGVEATDKIWLTCCALHNFLLEADGLHEEWNNGVPSDWEGDLGFHNSADVTTHAPFALHRLHASSYEQLRRYDTSGMGPGRDLSSEQDVMDMDFNIFHSGSIPYPGDIGIRVVKNLSLDYFRHRLVEHFNILFRQGKIQWPSRTGVQAPVLTEGYYR